jgi:hypothetical protein
MAWDGDRGELERVLARLFDNVPRSKLVLDRARVDTGLIDFSSAAALNWHAILVEVENQDRVQALVDAALYFYPTNPELLALARPLEERRAGSSGGASTLPQQPSQDQPASPPAGTVVAPGGDRTAMSSKKDFFISYNGADRAWAEWIAWQLEEAGLTCVVQAWDFRPGSNFVLEMQRAATESERTVAVLSPEYLAALYTQPEWAAAFVQDPTGGSGTLVPIRVRPCTLEGLLHALIYIDLVDKDEAVARAALLAGVRRDRDKPARAPAFPGGVSHTVPRPAHYPGGERLVPADYLPPPLPEDAPVIAAKDRSTTRAPSNGGEPAGAADTSRNTPQVRSQIYISYSHKDKVWCERIRTALQPYVGAGAVEAWDDGKIEIGARWLEEIKRALGRAKLAILLVSPNYLASPFITGYELPALLDAAEKEGLIIAWIAVSDSAYRMTEIAQYLAVNDPSNPLDSLSKVRRNRALVEIAQKVVGALAKGA